MTESIHPAAFISLTLLLYIPALWARFLANLDKHFALKLAIFVLYNLFIMFTLRDFINIGYLPLLGVSDSETLKSWASFMVIAHAFTFILPKKLNRWLMKVKPPHYTFCGHGAQAKHQTHEKTKVRKLWNASENTIFLDFLYDQNPNDDSVFCPTQSVTTFDHCCNVFYMCNNGLP